MLGWKVSSWSSTSASSGHRRVLMPMMPRGAHGAVTGLYSLSRGVGTSLGPLLAGVAIQAAGGDYRWTWLVCGAAILVSDPGHGPAARRPLVPTDWPISQ